MNAKAFRAAWRFWLAGILISVGGVLVARVWAPTQTGRTRTVLSGAGRLLGAAGLVVIAVGVSRRVTRDDERTPDPEHR